MRQIKKAISFILCFCMMFGFTLEAFAGSVKPSVDKTSVAAGESVTVTLTLDEDIANCTSFEYWLYYNSDKFTMTGSENGNSCNGMKISSPMTGADGAYYVVSFVDPS